MKEIEKYKIFDTLIEGVQIISPDWEYLYVNPASARQLNLEVSDFKRKKVHHLFPHLSGSELDENVRAVFETKKSFDKEIKLKVFKDRPCWYQLKLRPIDEGVLLMMHDITESKENQIALEKNEYRLRELYDSMHESFGLFEPIFDDSGEFIDLRFLEANATTNKVIAQNKFSLIGKLWTETAGIIDDYFKSKIELVLKKNKSVKFDIYIQNLKQWFAVTIHPLRDNNVGILASDITKRVKYKQDLEEFNKTLENKIRDRTSELTEALEREKLSSNIRANSLSIATHELKAPLSSIQICLDILDKDEVLTGSESYPKYRTFIQKEIDNLSSMITNFIAPTNKLLSRQKELIHEINIKDLLSEIIQVINQKTKQKIIHTHSGNSDLNINRDILRRVLINLLNNALKYSTEDVQVKTNLDADHLVIKISDQGIGIPVDEQENIFNKYFRASNTAGINGTGLGLSIVNHYVDILNGEISFESKENEGTTFNVKIPINFN